MQAKNNSVKVLLVIIISLLIFTNAVTYVFLLSKNVAYNTAMKEKQNVEDGAMVATEAFLKHLYYDGESIPCNQMVNQYDSPSKFVGSKNLEEVLRGDKVVVLLPTSCSYSEIAGDINKLLNLARKIGPNHFLIMADDAIHMQSEWSSFLEKEGYYETNMTHLGLKGLSPHEIVIMLTQNYRVRTSYVVCEQTRNYADGFYEYLEEYFKAKK